MRSRRLSVCSDCCLQLSGCLSILEMNQLDDSSLTRFSENGGYCCFSVGDLLSNHGPVDVESDTVRDPVSKDQHGCEEYLATSCIVSAEAPPPQDGHVLPEIPEAAEAEALKGKRNLYSRATTSLGSSEIL